ncbi:polysialyltransferase family glycosyltransferase [Vibrio hangzhouensis]|uniref:polysialyltransferase family glycosyltransferase n=1 Tax=Vibrio hangzhouensis TaxID=462991 RepID=UPI001C93C498|nr:polysialyltransferase family glycosyltransferase [Vibrio hangzhouensis]MBY6198491.1 glycosyltransferase [Vibrio hangzhouensis]
MKRNNLNIKFVFASLIPEQKKDEYFEILRRTINGIRNQNVSDEVNIEIVLCDDGSPYLKDMASNTISYLNEDDLDYIKSEYMLDVDNIVCVSENKYYNKGGLLNCCLKKNPSDYVIVLDDDHPFIDDECLNRFLNHFRNGYNFVVGRLCNPDMTFRGYLDNRVQGTTFALSYELLEKINFFSSEVRQWGCGEDTDTFYKVYQEHLKGNVRAIYDGNIITQDLISGRWRYCLETVGGEAIFIAGFLKKYGTLPHNNESRKFFMWMDYEPSYKEIPESAFLQLKLPDYLKIKTNNELNIFLNNAYYGRASVKQKTKSKKVPQNEPSLKFNNVESKALSSAKYIWNLYKKIRFSNEKIQVKNKFHQSNLKNNIDLKQELEEEKYISDRNIFGFIVGPWQLVSFTSSLLSSGMTLDDIKQNVVFVIYDQDPFVVRHTKKFIVDLIGLCDVIIIERELQLSYITRALNDKLPFESIYQILGTREIQELWIPKINQAPEKFILEAFPEAKIKLYEDGTASYIKDEILEYPLDIDLKNRITNNGVAERYIARVDSSSILLPEIYQGIEYKSISQISKESLISILERVHVDTNVPNKSLIILGQCLSKYSLITQREENLIYENFIKEKIDDGYTVFWKDHPRNDSEQFDKLAASIDSSAFKKLELPSNLPVEVLLNRLSGKDIEVSSFASSTLLYANHLLGFKSRLINLNLMLPHDKIRKIISFIDSNINP